MSASLPPGQSRVKSIPSGMQAKLLHAAVTLLAWCTFAVASIHPGQLTSIKGTDVVDQLLTLAKISDDPAPAVTRVLFTQHDMEGRKYIKGLMKDAGLAIREDAMGNIWGRWAGSDASAGAVVTGSHCDAIPLAGAYDGTLGVVGAIAAVRGLQKAGFKTKRPVDVLMFTSEEPTRFGLGCIGSRGMAGALTPETLDTQVDENQTSFKDAANAVGYGGRSHQDILRQTRVQEGAISAFVELHIEQGPLLEREGLQLGVVTAIAAPASFTVTFAGGGGHAGALLMKDRHDPILAAAEVALHLEGTVKSIGTEDTVGTSGSWQVKSNAINAVPKEVVLGIDIRDTDGDRRDKVVASVLAKVEEVARQRGVTHKVNIINADPPAPCSDTVISAFTAAAKELSLSSKTMVSRAYHDSLFMAQLAPTGMLFIPCKNGWSHRPDEFASPEDIENGVKALALTLARLAEGSSGSGQSAEEL